MNFFDEMQYTDEERECAECGEATGYYVLDEDLETYDERTHFCSGDCLSRYSERELLFVKDMENSGEIDELTEEIENFNEDDIIDFVLRKENEYGEW